ncbi:hypothetical protein [Antribacter gilvus]|uniref:hypothetical protein n=1 Tax=Antribacter gilvus TaxID=2304675 RepID=UPI000F789620|nr:hypothetical protein [Antribacter gilvus]
MASEEELDNADAEAMYRHGTFDACAAHALLAQKVWGALRGLGVERGRMLVLGDHAAVHAGISARGQVSTSIYEEWVAAIPPAGQDGRYPWPQDMVRLRSFTEHDPATHDVVITALPWSDVHFRSEYGKQRIAQIHNEYLRSAIAHAFPGGIVAAVASRQVLDGPETAHRELFLDNADLLGAARLPATFFRPDLPVENAEASDLLFLRRRLPGEPVRSADFLNLHPVAVPGGVEYVNEYYGFTYPEHIVGTAGVVGDADHDAARYTVRCDDEPVDVVLHHVVSRIVAQALSRGLVAVSASWHPPEARLAPEADRSVRAQAPRPPSATLRGDAPSL